VPKLVRPVRYELAEDPIRALGTMLRASIIGYLRDNGPATRGQIAAALEIPVPTVKAAIGDLVTTKLLIADPPPERHKSGQRVHYFVDDTAVSEMYIQLGLAIGEI
tara:strand:- start:151 stop:468 length:318 start_codon:yes stop_codon:yes gene_type:complete